MVQYIWHLFGQRHNSELSTEIVTQPDYRGAVVRTISQQIAHSGSNIVSLPKLSDTAAALKS